MSVIDRDIHLARALLVENNALLRSVAASQLRDLGIGHVSPVSRVKDARILLERERFDIVVCNREFDGLDDSGQDLLDELRRENQLPHSTVFLMVTSQASYHQVLEAAEAALDGLLVRPYTAALLGERLREARKRKRDLADILRALDAGQTDVALTLALRRFQEQQPYALYCGRLVAELLLNLQRPDDARRVFEKLALSRRSTWARLGVARALMASGDTGGARRTIAEVLADEPDSADAHDLQGRILVEQCDFDGALHEYRLAADITPGCLLRAQHAGALAFYQGRGQEALEMLERSLGLGVQSKLFDALTLMLIAALRFDEANAPGVASMREQLVRYRERFPGSRRLQRLEAAAGVLFNCLAHADESAMTALRVLSADVLVADFDLEAANLVLSLWARLPARLRDAVEHESVVEHIGLRFCTSKAITEVLLASAVRAEPAAGILRRCQAHVNALAEQAMDRVTRSDQANGLSDLLLAGEKTLNAKLLQMTLLMVRRHQSALPDAADMEARAEGTLKRCCQAVNHIAGIQRAGRSPGGLQLRIRSPEQPDAASA